MTAAQREKVRLELNRAMREDPRQVPALRLLDAATVDDWDTAPDVCPCGIHLGPADHLWCEACARDRGQR